MTIYKTGFHYYYHIYLFIYVNVFHDMFLLCINRNSMYTQWLRLLQQYIPNQAGSTTVYK